MAASSIFAVLDSFFKLKENGTSVRTEVIAGASTFLTMCYIVLVNPTVLSDTGMDYRAVFAATCIASALGCLLMGLVANYPIALAPGMGINAYFTYTVVIGMQVSWQVALGCVFLSSLLFVLCSITPLRALLIDRLPHSLKYSIATGIGLFLGFIGLKNAGLVIANTETFVALGDMSSPQTLYAILGFSIIVALSALRVRGAVIIGIVIITVLAMLTGHAELKGVVAPPPSLAPTLMRMDVTGALEPAMLSVVFVFLMVNIFDSSGSLIAVGYRAGLMKDGKLPRLRKALAADSATSLAASMLGSSPVVAFVESATGVAAGGRTGLMSATVGALFLLCLIFAPLTESVPQFATAPALIFVAILMCRGFLEIDWDDITEAAPAFLTTISMPLTYSIATGIALGFISFTLIKLLAGRRREVSPLVAVVTLLWIIKFVLIDHLV